MKLSTTIVGAVFLLALAPGARAQDGCREGLAQCAEAVATRDHDALRAGVRPAATGLAAAADAAAPSAAKAARPAVTERTPTTVRVMQWVFGLGMAVGIVGAVARRLRPRADPAAPEPRASGRSKQARTASAAE